ncbi:MarR family transcriptional regulator [Lactobacillus sp. LC28-10]|uniref:MarR family transcriptional regulator n=1 Tax=Secundilactobacillus angelensis TaxID=2722706 RepID=A0ABX1L084_9LACO|nr:MarR family transcriptional regulator [Secundilactobacillus angelensis]MCH5462911.1 MarR family transcriptional regulator [Secundilactobacillus angelensis]NLR19616.1 MarR family transcriptional regulator [Secundilactobacillus angelensis]
MFEIIRDIGAITRRIEVNTNAEFRRLGLANNAFIYVIRSYEKPGMFLGELADSVQIDRTTAFRTVRKLVDNGYLRLEDDASDKRLRRVYVAEKGAKVYPELHAFEQHSSDTLVSQLTDDEKAELKRLLGKLIY